MNALEEIFEFNVAKSVLDTLSGKTIRNIKKARASSRSHYSRLKSSARDKVREAKGELANEIKRGPSTYRNRAEYMRQIEHEANLRRLNKKVRDAKGAVSRNRQENRAVDAGYAKRITSERAKAGALYGGAGLAALTSAKKLDGASRRRRTNEV